MSFLFGWTKYFRNDLAKPAENDDEEEELEEEQEQEEEQEEEEEEEESLLGGDFETLEEEIAFLREQNSKLREKYKLYKCQHRLLCNNLKKTGVIHMKMNGKLVPMQRPQTNLTLDELTEKVEARLPQFLRKTSQSESSIRIPSDAQNEIGIIDIETVDWGEILKYNTLDANDALSTFNDDTMLQYENTQSLGEAFIVLRESDIIDAIACFVAQCVMNIPECHNLDHEEMLMMINGTFSELKTKGPLGKMYDWSTFIYQSYGWTATAYTVYTNAALAKTVLSCMVSAAWLIGVL